MGNCSSCPPEAQSCSLQEIKVVTEDGKLLELAGLARAAQVLAKRSETSFVCDADGMELDGYVSAMGLEDELRPGQLYFLLPLSMLKRRLHAEDMAALAVRASAALLAGGSTLAVGLPVEGGGREDKAGMRVTPAEDFRLVGATATARRRKGKASGRGRNFKTSLGAIAE